jgi:hypothetical protein
VRDKLVDIRANQDELRQGRDQWRSREHILMDQREYRLVYSAFTSEASLDDAVGTGVRRERAIHCP